MFCVLPFPCTSVEKKRSADMEPAKVSDGKVPWWEGTAVAGIAGISRSLMPTAVLAVPVVRRMRRRSLWVDMLLGWNIIDG